VSAPERVPPGYANAAHDSAHGIRPVTLVAAELVLSAALLVASARELLMRAPGLYFGPFQRDTSVRLWGLALGVGLGLLVARRRASARPALAGAALAVVSLLTSAAPLLFRHAFADAVRFELWALPLLFGTGSVLGLAAALCAAWLLPHGRALGLVTALLSPFSVACVVLVVALALGAVTALPLGHAAPGVGLGLALLAAAAAPLERYLTRRRAGLAQRAVAPAIALLAAALSLLHSEQRLPRHEVMGYGGEVLALGGERQHLALVSHRSHFELYADRTLKLSSIDAHRYAEALVHPALASATRRARVLLLGGGTGVVEREILRWPEVRELVVIATDRALPELARRSPWLAGASAGALDDPRVRSVEAEPLVWLQGTKRRFDVIIADIEDPIGYRQGKHFTRHALGLVAACLETGGAGSLQAPSPLTFPGAYASIGATLRAARLDAAPYHAAVPSLGDAGFFLFASPHAERPLQDRALDGARHLPAQLRFVTRAALPAFFHFPSDLAPALAQNAPLNTLHTQPLVELYGAEHERQPER
jgi:spermidine synthase